MSMPIKQEIIRKLKKIVFSDGTKMSARSSDIIIKGSNVGFSLDITNITLDEANSLRSQALAELSKLDDIDKINIVLTSNESKKESASKAKIHIENVDKLIVVAAGKGGVGKSTITALIAQKLSKEGKKVGILDADIYGPSIPAIFSLSGKPEIVDNKMMPLKEYGIEINSIGFLTDASSAISWRGPMISKALYQLLSLTKWNDLDYLLIDTPPGTGDIHLSLMQNYYIDSVIMVTTPQRISSIDVDRSINLYQKFNIPIKGIIENMSVYEDSVGKKINIFPGNNANNLAKKYDIPLLAKLPLMPALATACDSGKKLDEFLSLIQIKL